MSVVRTLIGNVKGPKGDTGSQGPQGVAGTIEIGSVQTVGYGSPASVTNSGTDTEAVLDFQIPQGAPGETVSDMSNLTLQTITDSTADYPTFAVGETGASIFGKIRKFLSDLKNNYVSKSMMTISTDISTEGQAVADAKAIKTLNDSLASLTTTVEAKDWYRLLATAVACSTTKATVNTFGNRAFSDYSLIGVVCYDASYNRAFQLFPVDIFKARTCSLTWVNSANQQFWVEVGYSTETSFTTQTSQSANGSYVFLFAIKF